jgi:hypothetical protein
MYYMSTLKIPLIVIRQIDKYRKHCLWRGSDLNKKENCLAIWKKVTRSKNRGGLGVINIEVQNKALLLKHLHKFFNKENVPWVQLTWAAHYSGQAAPQALKPKGSFWWRAICKLFDSYAGCAKASVGRGTSVLFWENIWDFGCLKELFPHLYSFAKEPRCSVQRFLSRIGNLEQVFCLPLSVEASQQLAELLESLDTWQRDENLDDSWTYIWGSGIFATKKAYTHLIGQAEAAAPFRWIWDSKCQGKHRIFFWLLLNDRLNTRNLLRRKKFDLPSVKLCSLFYGGRGDS